MKKLTALILTLTLALSLTVSVGASAVTDTAFDKDWFMTYNSYTMNIGTGSIVLDSAESVTDTGNAATMNASMYGDLTPTSYYNCAYQSYKGDADIVDIDWEQVGNKIAFTFTPGANTGSATFTIGVTVKYSNTLFGPYNQYYTYTVTNSYVPAPEYEEYTVTYTDGVPTEAIFTTESYIVEEGSDTPAFQGDTTREGYTFEGWNPKVADTVTGDATYTAIWEEIPAKTYTVTYTDGEDGDVFADVVFADCEESSDTPDFTGSTTREDYVFTGWSPEVADTVTDDATYTATWALDLDGDGIPDEDQPCTVTYDANLVDETVTGDLDEVTVDKNTVIALPTPVHESADNWTFYYFVNWEDQDDATYDADEDVTITEDMDFTAIWAKTTVNGDAAWNYLDAMTIMDVLAGDPPASYVKALGDRNDDGGVNYLDAMAIMDYMAG